MKEQYMKKTAKALSLPRKTRKEILRDLDEIFVSALENGETEQQVIERLGTPQEFASDIARQLGIDMRAARIRRMALSSGISLAVAAAAFAVCGALQAATPPENAIGQADAMTAIQVEGSGLFPDPLSLLLTVGILAAVIAVFQLTRLILAKRRRV